ncbi:MAG: ImmA/IrrE family metallo-endopeptidase [Syntrophomonadaceae bacterium]
MRVRNESEAALRVFYAAHKFLHDFGIRWLPVSPIDIIRSQPNWRLKYVHQLALEIGKTTDYVCDHVMRSKDGLAMYDVARDQYYIILNAGDEIPQTRMLWTATHEIGHIYLGHLRDSKVTSITADNLEFELYNQLEFEADIFAGEVLASKWIMRHLDIVDERDIALICGISDDAALNRYKKATEDYSFEPANAVFTLHNFGEYMKEVTVCRDRDDFEFGRFISQNQIQQMLPKPLPPFLRKPGTCSRCGNTRGITSQSNFCIACGSSLQKGLMSAHEPCDHVNSKDAAFCELCGYRVYRTRQGFCFEDWAV